MTAFVFDPHALAAALQAEVAVTDDMNEAVVGGGGGRIFPTGQYLGVLVGYVDLGTQPQEFGGKAKDPAPEFQLEFAVVGTEANETEPYIHRTFPMSLSRNEKSGAFKAFKAMNYTQNASIRHFAQFLGQPFLLDFTQYTPKGKDKPAMKLDLSKTKPPIDPISRQPYALPAYDWAKYIKYFLWNTPSLETWDALYVEGTWDDGASKNRTQETILGALNFDGSPLHQLLLQAGRQITKPAPKTVPATVAQPAQGVVPASPVATPTPTAVAAPAVATQAVAQPAQVAVPLAQPAAGAASAAQGAPSQAVAQPNQVAATPTGTTTSPSNAPVAAPAAVFAGIPGVAS